MEKNVETNLLEPHRNTGPSTASVSSGEDLRPDDLLDLLQQQSQTCSPAVVCVASKENDNSSHTSQQKTASQDIAQIQALPISGLLAFGRKSTLRGTPWEEALCGETPQTGKRSKTAGKSAHRTVKETEIVSFWTQFFG